MSNKTSQRNTKHLIDVSNKDKSEELHFENRIETDLDRRKWLSTEQAAQYLCTTPSGLRNRIYRGQIRAYKPFGQRGRSYFLREQLDQLLETSQN